MNESRFDENHYIYDVKYRKVHIIIASFAFLHALTACLCVLLGISDELILTFLTMVMIALVCVKTNLGVELTAVSIVVGNLVGYAMGKGIALFIKAPSSSYLVPAIATFATTLAVGYIIFAFALKNGGEKNRPRTIRDIIWVAVAVILIFFARVVVILVNNYSFAESLVFSEFTLYLCLSAFALQMVLFVYLGGYTAIAKRQAGAEKEKRHLAQYRYHKLSQQVNPHFLFNSLNILDSLVEDGKNRQASEYIQKLASLYRYLLRNEDETLVRLKDELNFVEQYSNLLKVRFQEGFMMSFNLSAESLNYYVVPCSLQLLVENATKHNSTNVNDPLIIKITASGRSLKVSNNIRPKIGKINSTGKGLKYLSAQYKDLSDKDISVTQTDTEFTVELPLL